MTTLKAAYLKHQKRRDGTYPLLIRISNNHKTGYINTKWYISEDDFDKSKNLRDVRTRKMVDERILELQDEITKRFGVCSETGGDVIVEHLKRKVVKDVDFIAHYRQFIKKMHEDGRSVNSISNYNVSLNHLLRFVGKDSISIKTVTINFLKRFSIFLNKNTGKRAVSLTLSCLRKVFNDARLMYNDEENDIIVVKHYPFSAIKIKQPISTKKRSVDPQVIKAIIKTDVLKNKRDLIGRDVFTLSFYLAGINLADLYYLEPTNIVRGRLEYNRHKTKSTRDDNAFMSILIPDEAYELINKYADPDSVKLFDFYKRYGKEKDFVKAVNKGLEHICKLLDIAKCTSYTARHTHAYIAKNNLNYSMDEVALLLNHSSQFKTTEIYTTRNYTITDSIIREVINYTLGINLKSKVAYKKKTSKKAICHA